MSKPISVAVLGATGMVGESILSILHERKFPAKEVFALASERSEGEGADFGQRTLTVRNAANFDFSKVDIAFFSAGAEASRHYVPIATAAGCLVIDNTSAFRYDEDVPLVIPEVNEACIKLAEKRRIIANPNCSTIQMLVALKPIYDRLGIEKIHVVTYQSVSGAGKRAAKELAQQSAHLLNGMSSPEAEVFSKQIAFNVLPHIDIFYDNGYTREEMKMLWETRKILGDASIEVNPTAVRVPVFYGHSESVHIQTKKPIEDLDLLKSWLKAAPGVIVVEDNEDYPTAVTHASGNDAVYVGRIRRDMGSAYGLNLWIVADNIRKGAALNSVQIAESYLRYVD